MRQLTLTPERRTTLVAEIQAAYARDMDETISAFRAEQLLELMLKALGPAVYNQAVQDVRAHLQGKLDDLDGEVYVEDS